RGKLGRDPYQSDRSRTEKEQCGREVFARKTQRRSSFHRESRHSHSTRRRRPRGPCRCASGDARQRRCGTHSVTTSFSASCQPSALTTVCAIASKLPANSLSLRVT